MRNLVPRHMNSRVLEISIHSAKNGEIRHNNLRHSSNARIIVCSKCLIMKFRVLRNSYQICESLKILQRQDLLLKVIQIKCLRLYKSTENKMLIPVSQAQYRYIYIDVHRISKSLHRKVRQK